VTTASHNLARTGTHTPSAPAEFVETARRCFEQAVRAAGGVRERRFQMGEQSVLLRFAGDQMVPLVVRALAHLEENPARRPDLTVCFFDSESTGTPMPPPPWSWEQYTSLDEIDGFNNGQVHVTYSPGSAVLHCLDRERGLAVYWTPSFRLIPWWEQSFPLRSILNWWLRDQPFQPAHAAAVGRASGGVLITGPSGTGKSTSTLACLGSELQYAGDDYVLIRTDPSPFVFSLYSTAKLEADNLERFPDLVPLVSNAERLDREKALIFLHEHHPRKLIGGFPIRALVIPKVTGQRETTVETISPAAALLALAPTTTKHLLGTRPQTVQKLMRLVKAVPSYRLLAGTDLPQIPVAISSLLDSLNPSGAK
jgi:hypothetical protein